MPTTHGVCPHEARVVVSEQKRRKRWGGVSTRGPPSPSPTVPKNRHSRRPQDAAVTVFRGVDAAVEEKATGATEAVEDSVPLVHSRTSASPLRVTAATTVPEGMREAPAPCS